jgi:hypothetical protein
MNTMYKNCEIIYRRRDPIQETKVANPAPQEDLAIQEDCNDNFLIIASAMGKEREILLDKFDQAKKEAEHLFDEVAKSLRATGQLSSFNEKCLAVLFDKCFIGTDPKTLCERYSGGSGQETVPARRLIYWRNVGRKLILDYLSESNTIISENLSDFIHDKERIVHKANKARAIDLKQGSYLDIITNEINDRISRTLKDSESEDLFNQSDLEEIRNKIRLASLRDLTLKSLRNFAFVVAKNEISSERESQAREKILSEKYKQEVDAEMQYNLNFRNAKEEYLDILAKHALEPKLVSKLGILYFTIFEKLTDEELQTRFPGTSRAVRDQWRRRARVFLSDKISPNLKQFLDYCTHRKSSNISPSIH